jgi:hypothetical protein
MVDFCDAYFSPVRCTTQGGPGGVQNAHKTPTQEAAIEMAHQASREIRDRAKIIGKRCAPRKLRFRRQIDIRSTSSSVISSPVRS